MSLPKFRRFYFPGLISLVLFPILCVYFLQSHNKFQQNGAMPITIANKQSLDEMSVTSGRDYRVYKIRKYRDVSINGSKGDEIELQSIGSLTNQLITLNDTINGLRVSFENRARYEEFINILDNCYRFKNHHLGFVPYEGKVLIWHWSAFEPRAYFKGRNFNNDHILIDDIRSNTQGVQRQQDQLNSILKVIIEFWPSILAFIAMVGFAVFRNWRFFDLKSLRFSDGTTLL